MRQTLKTLFLVAVMTIGLVSLSSCSEEDPDIPKSGVVGEWLFFHCYVWEKENGQVVWSEDYDLDYTYIFNLKKDGIVLAYGVVDGEIEDDTYGEWKLSGNKLTLLFGNEEPTVWNITFLSSYRMIISQTYKDGSSETYAEYTFIRNK